jgi:tagatose kinase
MHEALEEVLAHTDLFLPSGDELFLLSDAGDADSAGRELLDRGIRTVGEGAACYDASGKCSVAAFPVEEVDPTGAGDAFGATFVTFSAASHRAMP